LVIDGLWKHICRTFDLLRELPKTKERTSSLIRISTQCLKVRFTVIDPGKQSRSFGSVILYHIANRNQVDGWMDIQYWMDKFHRGEIGFQWMQMYNKMDPAINKFQINQ